MKQVFLSFLIFIFSFSYSFAQDSCSTTLRISLLTCAPGEELYSTFGHTAIRVQDVSAGVDDVYNYGTFAFAPDFYMKFVRGKLLYSLAVESFPEFMYQYQQESRSVEEQQLNLTCNEAQRLYASLQGNALPQNRDYRYDFLFDNCTTRARDIVADKSGGRVAFKEVLINNKPTYRNLIYVYLNRGHQDWSKLGIDLLLGAKMDRKATNKEAMFLPDNLLKSLDSATINAKTLVTRKQTILSMPSLNMESLWITPGLFFSALFFFYSGLSFVQKRWAIISVMVLDFFLFLTLGLTGILLLFMWFGTNHALCANNYNLLWALPTHLAIVPFLLRHKEWVQTYFKTVFVLMIILLISWFFLPQQMNNAFFPLVSLIALRSYQLSKKKRYGGKSSSL